MNILYVTTYLQGGAGKIITSLAESQFRKGNNIFVVTSQNDLVGYCNYEYYINELVSLGIKVIKIDSLFKRDIFLNMKVVKELRKLLLEEDIEIIHAHAAIPALISIIAKTGISKKIPILQTMHGWGLNKNIEHEFVDINIMNLIDKVITVSEADMRLLEAKGVESSKLQCIYNGIKSSTDELEIDEDINNIAKAKSDGYFTIGCIGTIGFRKNQELMLQAINDINENIAVVLIGDMENEEHFQKILETCNKKVLLLGYKKNAIKYMKYFDVLILPSRSEGLPISIIEAFKEKIPVICSDIEGCAEIVQDNVTGFTFKSNDKDDLTSKIKKVLYGDKRKTIGYAYEMYLEKFTEESMMKEYSDLYKKMMT